MASKRPASPTPSSEGPRCRKPTPASSSVLKKPAQSQVAEKKNGDGIQDKLLEWLKSCGRTHQQRLTEPAPLACGGFPIDTTLQRKAAFQDLFSSWKIFFERRHQLEKCPLVALPAAPGMGKTRFAWLAAAKGVMSGKTGSEAEAEWKDAFDGLPEDSFKQGLKDAVGVTVTFNNKAPPLGPGNEETRDMVGVRMLHSHFCKSDHSFSRFHAHLKQHGWHEISPLSAINIIKKDIGRDQHVVLVVDEPMRILDVKSDVASNRAKLRFLMESIGGIINTHRNVHILVTSVSATLLVDSMQPAVYRPLHFVKHFELFEPQTVDTLVNQCSDDKVKEVLKMPQFQAVLRECLGLPRLIEHVLKVADSYKQLGQLGQLEQLCANIRTQVHINYAATTKYADSSMRSAALVAAFSQGLHYETTVARRGLTTLAELSGYVVSVCQSHAIPPLLLWSWQQLEGNSTQSKALLSHAEAIYFVSETSGSAEHASRFEKQVGYLYQLRSLVDTILRNDLVSSHSRSRPRTVLGLLGGLLLANHPPVDTCSPFCQALKDAEESLLQGPMGQQPEVKDMIAGKAYLATPNQTGFDVAIVEETSDGRKLLVLIAAKLSHPGASTTLSAQEVKDKIDKALGVPEVKQHFDEGRLCFIIGGLRHLSGTPQQIVEEVVKADDNALAKRRSLVLLTPDWTRQLLTPTLASIPPFR